MKKTFIALAMSLLFSVVSYAQSSGNNSVYIDQTNADNSVTTITQTGSGNQVGDRNDLVTPAFIIDGNNMSLTVEQTGMNNKITGNFIGGDSTALIEQTGAGNSINFTMGNFGTNGGSMSLKMTGDNNTSNWTLGNNAAADNYNYTLNVTGNTNAITSSLNSKYIVNTINITGDNNQFTTTQVGAHGTATTPGHQINSTIIGSQNVVSILQNGTTTPNIVTLNVTGTGTSTTIVQH